MSRIRLRRTLRGLFAWVACALCSALVLTGCFGGGLKKVDVRVTSEIEYSAQPVKPDDYVVCDSESVEVTVRGDVNAHQVGEQVVPVELKDGLLSDKRDLTFVVRDTQPPVIDLKAESATVAMGEKFDLHAYVKGVSDPVDGALREVAVEPKAAGTKAGLERWYDAGFYMVGAAPDTSKAGKTSVEIRAVDQHGNEAKRTFALTVADPFEGVKLEQSTAELEYSKKEVDPLTLVKCADAGVKITCSGKIDLTKLGEQTVTYTLTKGTATKQASVTFKVRDTKGPAVKLKADEVSIVVGDAFDPYGNVESVADPVDGELARVDSEPAENGEGWYTVTGDFDAGKPGKYFLTLAACDRAGNRVTKEFSLVVEAAAAPAAAPEEAEPESEPEDEGRDYVLNTNTMKFHYPGCKSVKKMKDSNREDVHATREEVISWGYSPCGNCNP